MLIVSRNVPIHQRPLPPVPAHGNVVSLRQRLLRGRRASDIPSEAKSLVTDDSPERGLDTDAAPNTNATSSTFTVSADDDDVDDAFGIPANFKTSRPLSIARHILSPEELSSIGRRRRDSGSSLESGMSAPSGPPIPVRPSVPLPPPPRNLPPAPLVPRSAPPPPPRIPTSPFGATLQLPQAPPPTPVTPVGLQPPPRPRSHLNNRPELGSRSVTIQASSLATMLL
jgi:hypothetical protein